MTIRNSMAMKQLWQKRRNGLVPIPKSCLQHFEPLVRFWRMVKLADNGCWLWQGYKENHGYGIFYPGPNDGRHTVKAHRWSYAIFIGLIPDNMEIDHLCSNPSCVNPNHLEVVSHKTNVKRGKAGAAIVRRQRGKTHCPQGHPYSSENTYTSPQGYRQCRQCHRERDRLAQWQRETIIKSVA